MAEFATQTAEREILRREWSGHWRVWKEGEHITADMFLSNGLPLSLELNYTKIGEVFSWHVVMFDTEQFSLHLAEGDDLAVVLRAAKRRLADILRVALVSLGEVSDD